MGNRHAAALLVGELESSLREELLNAANAATVEDLAAQLADLVALSGDGAATVEGRAAVSRLLSGAAADATGEFDSAQALYDAMCNTALCLVAGGAAPRAMDALRAAAAVDDAWARHHHYYGIIHALLGDTERARWELEVALQLEPFADGRERIQAALEALTRQEEPAPAAAAPKAPKVAAVAKAPKVPKAPAGATAAAKAKAPVKAEPVAKVEAPAKVEVKAEKAPVKPAAKPAAKVEKAPLKAPEKAPEKIATRAPAKAPVAKPAAKPAPKAVAKPAKPAAKAKK